MRTAWFWFVFYVATPCVRRNLRCSAERDAGAVPAVPVFGAQDVTRLNIYSLVMVVIGSEVFLLLYHAILGRRCI
jgi:hypothetical protein